MLPILYNGYRRIFGDNYSGAKWGLWCLAFGVITCFIFHWIANNVITQELARQYLFLFIIVIFIAITVYNNFANPDVSDENQNDNDKESDEK